MKKTLVPRGVLVAAMVMSASACKKSDSSGATAEGAKARIAKFNQCADTVFESARPGEHSALLVRCVSDLRLFGKAKCNAAWSATAAAPPAERWRLIAYGCGRAYCPTLKRPKPKLCARLDRLAQTKVRPEEWRALFRAVLRAEMGGNSSESALHRALRALVGVLSVEAPSRADPGPRRALAKVSAPAFVIEVRTDGSYWMASKKVDRQEILSRLKQASAAEKARGVIIKVHRSAAKARVVGLFVVLEQAGITRFAVTMERE